MKKIPALLHPAQRETSQAERLLEQSIPILHTVCVRKLLPLLVLGLSLLLTSCLTEPVATSGGPGSITVANTNPTALIAAMNAVFPQYGYTPGPTNFPDSVSFDKPDGALGNLMYGSYGVKPSIRVQVSMVSIPGTKNYRLIPRVFRVDNAGQVGFEDKTKMMSLWAGQYGPLLKQVQAQAGEAGGY